MPPDDHTQQLVASRYRLLGTIGAGGMGQVWRGEDVVLERPVAVKAVELPAHLDGQERDDLRNRVLREARAAARIHHPDSVQVFDVVEEGDRVYLVMELVESRTLGDVVEREGPLDPAAAAAMGARLVGALTAAHRAGIVHRDVKPRNVMVASDGRVKLADFGVASVKDDPRITRTGIVLGTPSYMSPEQARGETAGTAADLWGLGALLYYAVEGHGPFDRGESLPTLNAVLHDDPRPMERAGPLAPVILALLQKEPSARPTAEEAYRLLDEVAHGRSAPTAAPVAPMAATRVDVPAVTGPRPRPPAPAGDNRGWLVALALVAVVALLAVVGLVLANDDDDGGPTAVDSDPTVEPDGQPVDDAADENAAATTTAPDREDPATTEPGTDDDRPADVPADWVRYVDDEVGWSIWHPRSWQPRQASATAVDFRGPGQAYLRVDHTTSPGDDAEEAWKEFEERFAAEHDDYERIRLEETDYRDYEAAIWEYTYAGQRATNLGFVVDDDLGFALNFQTPIRDWESLQDERELFESSFRAA